MKSIGRTTRRARVAAAAVALAWATTVGAAQSARAILDHMKALEDGERHWTDRQTQLTFTIHGRGAERVRELVLYERRYPGDEARSIMFFEAPPEVKGTGLLAHTYPGHTAEQWLYVPEFRRIRQITRRARTESFVGSDLSYEDLGIIQDMRTWGEEDASSTLLRDETVDGVPTHVIALRPHRDEIHYQKIQVWLGVDDLVPRRLEFFETDDGEPSKRIAQRDVRMVGAIPVAYRVEVETTAAGSHTEIATGEVAFDQGLRDDLFAERALERGGR
jgi:uncharacterized protein